MPFERLLFALGIRYVGQTVAKKLASHFGSIDALAKADVDTLVEVDEIGSRIAESVVDFFASLTNIQIIDQLKMYGLQFESKLAEDQPISNTLSGQSFVISVFLARTVEMKSKSWSKIMGVKFQVPYPPKQPICLQERIWGQKTNKGRRARHLHY